MDKFGELKKWVMSNGGFVSDSLKLCTTDPFGSGHTLVATKEISENEELIRIPSKLCIYDKSFVKMVDKMLYELFIARTSFYKPYLDLLPAKSSSDFTTHPLVMFVHDPTVIVEWCQVSPEFGRYIKQLYNVYTETLKHLQKVHSHENILYGVWLALTRAWIKSKGNGSIICSFNPVIDLMQHRNYKSCQGHWHDMSNGCMQLTGGDNISEWKEDNDYVTMNSGDNYGIDDEVYDDYGFKTGLEMLAQYNFVSSLDKPRIPIKLQLENHHKFTLRQLAELTGEYGHQPTYLDENGPNDFLLWTLRILNTHPSYLKRMYYEKGIQTYETAYDPYVEAKIKTFICNTTKQFWKEYSATVDKYEDITRSNPVTSRIIEVLKRDIETLSKCRYTYG